MTLFFCQWALIWFKFSLHMTNAAQITVLAYSLHINLYEKLKLYCPKLGNTDYVQFNVTCFKTVTPIETLINF
jgi:hypothetical protein